MKAVIFCCLMALLCHKAEAQIKKSDLQGAWKLVGFHEIVKGKADNAFPGYAVINLNKIWYGNHVMFVGNYKSKKHNDDDYGLGTWKLDGNKYEEIFPVFSYKDSQGKTVRLKIEMKGDTLIETFPVSEKLEFVEDTLYESKYIKIKN